MKKNVIILAPISNNYMNYYDVIKNDTLNNYLIFIMEKHRDNYPEKLPKNIMLVTLSVWNESYIEYVIYKKFSKKADLIFAYSEEQIKFAAQLRNKYCVQGQSLKSAIQFRDKYIMIKTAQLSGVRVPKYFKVDSVFDLVEASKKIGYPFVIKPIDGMGSMNTFIIKNSNELLKFAKQQEVVDFIAEEFIDFDLYHVDGFVRNNKLAYLIPSKYFENTLSFYKGHSTGSVQVDEANPLYNLILKFTKKLLEAFETPKDYIFHLEVFSDGKEIIFLEIGSRLGGGRILQEIENEFNFNPVQELLKVRLGLNSRLDKNKKYHIQKIRGFVLPLPGKGKLISLPAKVPAEIPFKGIYDYYQYAKIGQKYNGAHNSGEAIAAISVEGDNQAEVKKILLGIDKWVRNNTIYKNEVQ